MTELEREIQDWDMKSADVIGVAYARHANDVDFVDRIVELMADVPLQRGTMWLLKRYLESVDEPLERDAVDRIYNNVGGLEHWESKLHFLQCMAQLPVPDQRREDVAAFLRECIASEKKFVRPSAYSGFRELASQQPQYQPETSALLEAAIRQETAGSVRSRVQRAVEEGF